MSLTLFFQIAIGVFFAIIISIPISIALTKALVKIVEFIDFIERKKYGNKSGVDLELEKTRKKLNSKHSRF